MCILTALTGLIGLSRRRKRGGEGRGGGGRGGGGRRSEKSDIVRKEAGDVERWKERVCM